jgi:hypothetical protein
MMQLDEIWESDIRSNAPAAVKPPPIPRLRGTVAWLAPDLALSLALTTLFLLFALGGGATSLFHDSDTGWHIRNGGRIVSTGMLPRVDPFSFSKPGEPWVAWEWGADVLTSLTYSVSGLAGVALLYGLCIAASVWMWARLNAAAGGSFVLTCLFFFPMLPVTNLHWLARPHIFSWLFLLATVWFCERMPRPPRWGHLVFAAVFTALWANIHGSFFFGPLIALIYGAGAYLKPLIWKNAGPTRARGYVLLALAAFTGTLANPSGWRLHQHVFSYLFDTRLLASISEFQSFDFHAEGAIPVILTLALSFTGAIAALAARKPERFLLSVLLAAVALRSVRALPIAALLLLPLANGSISTALFHAAGLTPGLRRALDNILAYGFRLQAIQTRFHGFAMVPLAAILIYASIQASAGFPRNEFPVEAASQVASLPAGARIFAPDTYGGYLIYRFDGGRKVFFDGRSDFYGVAFVESYRRLRDLQPSWRTEFNRWKFTYALMPTDSRLIPALEENGWREIYRDPTAVLLTGRARL